MKSKITGVFLIFVLFVGMWLPSCDNANRPVAPGILMTPIPTYTPCGYPGNTCTITLTFTPTFTLTATSTFTPTITPTPTLTPTFYCTAVAGTVTPGPGYVNNACPGTNFGTVSSGTTVTYSGIAAGGNYDWVIFTAGATGNWKFFYDCYDSGGGDHQYSVYEFAACSLYLSTLGSGYPYIAATQAFTSGNVIQLGLSPSGGTVGAGPYRLTIIAP